MDRYRLDLRLAPEGVPSRSRFESTKAACMLVPPALRLALLAPLLVPALAARGVVTVDASGGGDFSDLQAAVDAAAPGDLLLVRSGAYSGFAVDGKPLNVVADTGAVVTVAGTVLVENIAAGTQLTLGGLEILIAPPPVTTQQLRILNCDGAVLVEDTLVRLAMDLDTFSLAPLISVSNAASVSLVRCRTDDAGHVATKVLGLVSAPGIRVTGSTLHLFDCDIQGLSSATTGVAGESGVAIVGGSDVFASGSTFRGGDGGDAFVNAFFDCFDAGDGGHALEFVTPGSATLLDTGLLPGEGGEPLLEWACNPPSPGSPVAGTGTVTMLTLNARAQAIAAPVRDGDLLVATHSGADGDLVLALFSLSLAPTPFLSVLNGPILPDLLSLQFTTLGVVPPSGELTTNFTVSFGQAGAAGIAYVQGLFLTPGGDAIVSGGEPLIYLGPGL